jgi:acetoin utilization protein AcuC
MPLAILYSPDLKEYDFGPGHPFRGDRYQVFPGFLRQNLPEGDRYLFLQAKPASEEDLLLICDKDYIDITREYFDAAALGRPYPSDLFRFQSGDNLPVGMPGRVEEAARLIIGQAKKACDLVQRGDYRKVVSIGGGMHHAKRRFGEGFCVYNDVAFCGRYLEETYGLDRILILDTDAHAGNGTTTYFYQDPRVLFIDIHQDPFTIYPGTGFATQIGEGAGEGFTVNIPLPEHAGDKSYRLAFESIVEPIVREFRPQVIVRNGGSDPHFSDGLTSLCMTVDGFRMIGDKTHDMAEICEGKVVDLIASGYNRKLLPYCWLAQISGLGKIDCDVRDPDPPPPHILADPAFARTERVLEQVRGALKPYWSCMR